jgi:hypothetical protein
VEDSRHAVSAKVLEHYNALKSGKPTTSDTVEDTGRKPLEGDWYIYSQIKLI